MRTNSVRLDDLNAIRCYVNATLSARDNLQVGSFPLTERVLVRGGRPCGMYFCLHGPRALQLAAIWETDSNAILFYSARGERFHKTQLETAPELCTLVAA
jgi:hypothetical protein